MEEGLPSHSVPHQLVEASSQHFREPENDDTVDDTLMEVVSATVKELSLSDSGADEVPPSTKPKRRRKPRGGGSKHTPISESLPIEGQLPLLEAETILSSRHQDQKEEDHNYNEISLSTTTTSNPQQNQQQTKQKRSRRRKKELNPKSDQQQQDQCEQQQHQELLEIHENDHQNEDVHTDEDEDDYPSSMYKTAAITENEADHHDHQTHEVRSSHKERKIPKRTIMEELTFLKRISSTRCQVDLGRCT